MREYRDSDAPSVFEPQWVEARTELERALELDPGDGGIEGRLRLAQAHIDRIEAGALKGAAHDASWASTTGPWRIATRRGCCGSTGRGRSSSLRS